MFSFQTPGCSSPSPVVSAASASSGLDGSELTIRAKVSGPNTKLSWTRVPGAASYRVWRSSTENGKKTVIRKRTSKLTFVDKTGKSGKVYWYHVQARAGKNRTRIATSKPFQTVTRVYVETGHGTGDNGVWDSGCCWNGYQEAKLMIPIARATAKHLKRNGIYVYTDAYTGNNRNLNYTMAFLRKHSVSVFLNIHCDAAFEDPGTLPLYRTKEQKKLARALNKGVHKFVSLNDRGLERRKDLETLNNSSIDCTACLFEAGNIKKDNRKLRKKADAFGKGFAKGICDYLGMEYR